jgi:hypothetical protein
VIRDLPILDRDDIDVGVLSEEERILVVGLRPAGDDQAVRIAGLHLLSDAALELPVPGVAAQSQDVDRDIVVGAEQLGGIVVPKDRIEPAIVIAFAVALPVRFENRPHVGKKRRRILDGVRLADQDGLVGRLGSRVAREQTLESHRWLHFSCRRSC